MFREDAKYVNINTFFLLCSKELHAELKILQVDKPRYPTVSVCSAVCLREQ